MASFRFKNVKLSTFPEKTGARKIFKMSIEMVQTSCGMSVLFFDYVSEREQLDDWADKKVRMVLRTTGS